MFFLLRDGSAGPPPMAPGRLPPPAAAAVCRRVGWQGGVGCGGGKVRAGEGGDRAAGGGGVGARCDGSVHAGCVPPPLSPSPLSL